MKEFAPQPGCIVYNRFPEGHSKVVIYSRSHNTPRSHVRISLSFLSFSLFECHFSLQLCCVIKRLPIVCLSCCHHCDITCSMPGYFRQSASWSYIRRLGGPVPAAQILNSNLRRLSEVNRNIGGKLLPAVLAIQSPGGRRVLLRVLHDLNQCWFSKAGQTRRATHLRSAPEKLHHHAVLAIQSRVDQRVLHDLNQSCGPTRPVKQEDWMESQRWLHEINAPR